MASVYYQPGLCSYFPSIPDVHIPLLFRWEGEILYLLMLCQGEFPLLVTDQPLYLVLMLPILILEKILALPSQL